MKPMPYTPVIVCDEGALGSFFFRGDPREMRISQMVFVDQELAAKRLSDAECAAHFHQAGKLRKVWELSEVLADEDYSKQINGNRRAEIVWRRFATTPHAFGGPDGSAQ